MSTDSFKLANRDEILSFERLLNEYVKSRTQVYIPHLSLVEAFDYVKERKDGGRIFVAFLDLQINFAMLFCDLRSRGAMWDTMISGEEAEEGSVLDSPDSFFAKMDVHRYNSIYVLRYRALWDKIMGFVILLLDPENYERFCASKSKRRSFRRLVENIPQIDPSFAAYVTEALANFDNTFRTPEAHGTGSLRKWSFVMAPIYHTPQYELLKFWNMINQQMIEIVELIKKSDNPTERNMFRSPA